MPRVRNLMPASHQQTKVMETARAHTQIQSLMPRLYQGVANGGQFEVPTACLSGHAVFTTRQPCGVTDHKWSVEEIVGLLDFAETRSI